jgi:CBS domain-containing protein
MLAKDLINPNIPQLQLDDTVVKAKQLINDFKLTHLPVVAEKRFLGMISEEDLLDVEEEKIPIELIQEHFNTTFIMEDVHFLNALNFCNKWDSNIIPVLSKSNEFFGAITSSDLLKTMGDFSGSNEIGGLIILEMESVHFSISEISRIVESNDCTILHLNTTIQEGGLLLVTIHLNKREISSVVATFQRFEYEVKHHFGATAHEDKTDINFRNLMNYLGM